MLLVTRSIRATIAGPNGRTAAIVTAWIVPAEQTNFVPAVATTQEALPMAEAEVYDTPAK
jgi:hypothetical protein